MSTLTELIKESLEGKLTDQIRASVEADELTDSDELKESDFPKEFIFKPKFNVNYRCSNMPAYLWLWVFEHLGGGKIKRHVLTFVDDSISSILKKVNQEYAKWAPTDSEYINAMWPDFLNEQLPDCIKFDQVAKKYGLVFKYDTKLPKDEYLPYSFRYEPKFKKLGKYLKGFVAQKDDLTVIYCPDEAFILKIKNGVYDSEYTDFDDFSIKLPELMRPGHY